MNVLARFVMLSTLLSAAACAPKTSGTAIDEAYCRAWGSTLFLPSREDTGVTAEGLTAQINDYTAVCPGWPVP